MFNERQRGRRIENPSALFAVYDAWKERNIKIMSYGLIATLIVVAIVVGAITTKNVRLS